MLSTVIMLMFGPKDEYVAIKYCYANYPSYLKESYLRVMPISFELFYDFSIYSMTK